MPKGPILSPQQWRAKVKEAGSDAAQLPDAGLYKSVSGGVIRKEVDEKDLVIPWIVSTDQRDRDGDRIIQRGISFEQFRQNPVVLFAHNSRDLPIGRAKNVKRVTRNGKLVTRMEKQFTSQEENPFGFMVFNLASKGFLNAASIGFIPTEAEIDETLKDGRLGFVFKQSDLLESSVVPIPSNPGALQDAESKGIDITPYVPFAERVLDEKQFDGRWMTQHSLEDVWKIANAKRAEIFVVNETTTGTLPSQDVEELEDDSDEGLILTIENKDLDDVVTIDINKNASLEDLRQAREFLDQEIQLRSQEASENTETTEEPEAGETTVTAVDTQAETVTTADDDIELDFTFEEAQNLIAEFLGESRKE